MLIFWKQRLVFLATPKTGSTSIETALESMAHVVISRPPELKHMSANKFGKHFAPMLESVAGQKFTTVALMREPIDWLGSWYRYRQRADIPVADRSTKGLTFEEAASGFLNHAPAGNKPAGDKPVGDVPVGDVPAGDVPAGDVPTNTMNVTAQSRFLGWKDGRIAVDRVFRYEAIDQFVHFLEDRLKCKILLPRLNVSPKGSLALSDDTEARLRAKFAPDYQIYESLDR